MMLLLSHFIGLLFRSNNERKTLVIFMLDVMAILAQVSALIVWPMLVSDVNMWLIPIAVTLISLRWWENYLSSNGSTGKFQLLPRLRNNFQTQISFSVSSKY